MSIDNLREGMIPIKLLMRNFMCYRGEMPPLDFRGIQLACLAGQNGHGKSALLDAMTWALWSKARSSHDNDLISLGETEMEVEFDFALGDNLYRIIRKRSGSGRGRTSLEFQVKHDGGFNPLTETSVRQTQQKINDLLRMDYDTFVNSAFLLQGRANEFTMKSPSDRKRILGEILDLSVYDVYEQRARDRAREAASDVRVAQARIEEMDRELQHRPQYEAELAQAQVDVESLGRELSGLEERVSRQRQEQRLLDLQRRQHDELGKRMARAQSEFQELAGQLNSLETRLARLQEMQGRREAIEAGYRDLQETRAADADMGAKLSALLGMNQEKAELEQRIHVARLQLESMQREQSQKLDELGQKASRIQILQGDLADARTKLGLLAEKEAERERKRAEIQANLTEIASLQATNQRLREDMADVKEKIGLLQAAEARCPLCASPLTGEHRADLLRDFEATGKERGNQFRANKERVSSLKQANEELEQRSRGLDRDLQERAGLQRSFATLERELAEAERARIQMTGLRADLDQLATQLAGQVFANEEREALARVEAQIMALGYDAASHEQVRERVRALAHFEREHQELQTATQLLDETRDSVARLQSSRERSRESLERDQVQLETLRETLSAGQGLDQELQKEARRLQTTRDEESRARLKLGAAQQKIDHCTHLEEERKRQRDRLQSLAETQGLYQELQTAFGQKGLRAMIIESAIPEIEEEANRLLARMTENRMHVRFETQRETLKRDVVETLEIKIADELGTRDYEMYSGGEAFRVDFAIRIALSKLLARRAGAQLQTLVIDEGFGTQDAQGRERLVEAISSIRDDFACILVITHIEELQDAFPARINVTKTPEGSRFELA